MQREIATSSHIFESPRPGPTTIEYAGFDFAYACCNRALFGGALPDCLIVLTRKAKVRSYFRRRRFGTRDGGEVIDEIGLNPSYFAASTDEEILSNLAHEMAHCWQAHFG